MTKMFVEKMNSPESILYEVQKGLEAQFMMYSWSNMIDDLDLTDEEKQWAKEHTGYRAVLVE